MWICASCGTQARQPEVCSGCGSRMRPFDQPARPFALYMLALGQYDDEGYDQFIGPFPTVMEADQWWDQHHAEERFKVIHFHEVILLENPHERTKAEAS